MCVKLTQTEKELLARIHFEGMQDVESTRLNGELACQLMESLINRNGIPDVRLRYFVEPEFFVGGHGSSRKQIFERNGKSGDAIYRDPNFLKYLRYFLVGPDLPTSVIEGFQREVDSCQPVTSGDIEAFVKYARQQARSHFRNARKAAEEFFKLAIECNLDADWSRTIRDAVKQLR